MKLDYNVAKQLIEEYALRHVSVPTMPWLDPVTKIAGFGIFLGGKIDERIVTEYATEYARDMLEVMQEELTAFAQAGYTPSSEITTFIIDTRTVKGMDPVVQGFIVGWACVMKRSK